MDGRIDLDNQSFLTFAIGRTALDFLIDTGFNGSLLIGEDVFDPADAVPAGAMTAELASGEIFQYRTYLIGLEWLGRHVVTRTLVGPGRECLIGTALLDPHRLEIDYRKRTVRLSCDTDWQSG